MVDKAENKKQRTAIKPTRQEDYAGWYLEVIRQAKLAEHAVVRGCMVMLPTGYALWEGIQAELNGRFKVKGHKNVYFPMFIPMSFMQKEGEHVEGFAKECAVVTHHRLMQDKDGKLQPAAPLAEPLVIRPTSETIIGHTVAKWVQSYRDLPIKLNQWANIVRWEMRTRMFLRTSEFLWQEGHTFHETAAQAEHEAEGMLALYEDFVRDVLAIPVIAGEKSKIERFPGAERTFTIEAMMQDGKALQAGTSHFLGQKFAKAFDISYLDEKGQQQHVWSTSWGVSTRLIGGLIMTHSDDDGLCLPPRIAPTHVVILPLVHKEEDRAKIMAYVQTLQSELVALKYVARSVEVEIDDRSMRPGEKAWQWVKQGVPIRIEVGMKEVAANAVTLGRRDQDYKQRQSLDQGQCVSSIVDVLAEIQDNLFQRALKFQKSHTRRLTSLADLKEYFKKNNGFVESYWGDDPILEEKLKDEIGVTVRCFISEEVGPCIVSGKPGRLAIFAKAY
jgi:prolyl-tRNA synthetase